MATRLPQLLLAHWLLAVAAALLLGLAAAPASQAQQQRGVDGPGQTGVSQAHAVSVTGRCTINRTAQWQRSASVRRREASRVRRCRRRQAAEAATAPTSLYWGAWIGDQLTGEQPPWDMTAVSKFEEMTGKHASVVHFAAPFANCSSSPCTFYSFPADPMESIRRHGAIPFFSWSSQSIPSSLSEPNFQLSDVIAGTYDSYIREFAEAAKAWGHPFFLRFNWEMNGNWFPWSEGVNGNQPGEYVAAWRHVHDIFAAVGATNATWVWCPMIDPGNTMQDLASLYPGDEYVDWTGLDGYNWGPARAGGWKSFNQLYEATYDRIVETIAPSKPMIIGEVGSTERGGSKAAWIHEMLSELPTNYPEIRGVLWFEKYDDGMDWPIETSTNATGAFAAGIQSSSYVSGDYSALPPSVIQPPS